MSALHTKKPGRLPRKTAVPTGSSPLDVVWSGSFAHPAFISLALLLVTFAVFRSAGTFSFINYDDHDYVTENFHVLNGLTWAGIEWAFTTGHTGNWHPLTWLSHMADCGMFGGSAGAPHRENALLHAANAVLLFLVLWKFSRDRWRPAFVAGLFALHPLHVESVAWVSERKDVLSTFFGLLTLCAYGRYAADGNIEHRTSNTEHRIKVRGESRTWLSALQADGKMYYGLALLFFALGLMSKPMLVTLPFVMLLLDWWPLGRIQNSKFKIENEEETTRLPGATKRSEGGSTCNLQPATFNQLLLEKIPFFALSLASSVGTWFVQRAGGAVQSLARVPLGLRLENVLVSYARYLGKIFLPVDLATPYPYPSAWPLDQVLLAAGLVAGLSVAAVWLARKRPWFFVGWFWFLGMLVPVIGFVQVGMQSMADRYMYLPAVGIFIVLAWGAGEAVERTPAARTVLAAAGVTVLIACAFQTEKQLGYWRNSGTLFSHTLAVTKNNDVAYSSLGNYLLEQGKWEKAIDNYKQALQCARGADAVRVDVGSSPVDVQSAPDVSAAGIIYYEIDPNRMSACAEVLNNLGTALAGRGQTNEAMQYYRAALKLNPNHALALHNLGLELAVQKQYAQAVEYYEAAVRARPDAPQIRDDLGSAFAALGRNDEAVAQYTEALRLNPGDARAENELGLALAAAGRPEEALAHYAAALRADPGLLEVHNNLGSALVSLGRLDEAIEQFRLLLQLMSGHDRAHENLGIALASKGRLDEAVVELREAVRLQPGNGQTCFNLGNVLAMKGNFIEAEKSFREAIRLQPDLAPAHCNLGGVLLQLGRRAEAIAQFQEALRLNPHYEQAREQLRTLGEAGAENP